MANSHRIECKGGGAVGKSSLIIRYMSNEYTENDTPDPTLMDEYTALLPINGQNCTHAFPCSVHCALKILISVFLTTNTTRYVHVC